MAFVMDLSISSQEENFRGTHGDVDDDTGIPIDPPDNYGYFAIPYSDLNGYFRQYVSSGGAGAPSYPLVSGGVTGCNAFNKDDISSRPGLRFLCCLWV